MPFITNQPAPASRAQWGATMRELADLQGNRDGLWANEHKPAGTPANVFERQPLVNRAARLLNVGLSTADEMAALRRFRAEKEKAWGRPVTLLGHSELRNGELFAIQKAIALTRMERTPDSVTEGFVHASGSVDGQAIASRQIFWQRFRPTAEPNGKVVLVSPGFQETGRHFYEQIRRLNALGYDVLTMDHQWAGQSDGKAGGLDRGFGAARDVAAMAAFAQKVVEAEYASQPGAEVLLYGNSMGAGPGVLGALVLNEAGLIQLDGKQMPVGLSAMLQSPYLESTPNRTNRLLGAASRLPVVNRIAAPSIGVPVLTSDPVGAQKVAQSAVLEDIRARLATMTAAEPDMRKVRALLEAGVQPTGNVHIVHGNADPLADPAASRWLAGILGEKATLVEIDSANHVMSQTPGEQNYAVQGIERLAGVSPSQSAQVL